VGSHLQDYSFLILVEEAVLEDQLAALTRHWNVLMASVVEAVVLKCC
jgi:hypothetical protein